MGQNPRAMALRFRIWQVANAEEWNITIAEIADRLGDVSPQQVARAAQMAGWLSRLRVTARASISEYMVPHATAARSVERAVAHELAGTSYRSGAIEDAAI